MNRSAAEIFHEARELPPEQRATYLLGACGKDVALRSKVEALLKADGEAGGFMASPTGEPFEHTLVSAPPSQEQAGAQIGRYKLLEQIGEGGMGTIWMAEQREPVRRRVALKIIKLGMDTKQVIARFEAERQALAMMDHPNIAKVLDAGATETGRPYFVMEYIKGVPILEYCDREKVDTRARLDLFTKVCQAIQHAHQKGIIHRDIKPSNVLVTLHDGVPVPKVIDFGIAKATNSELTTKTLFTEHRQMIGTPAYMSPEQAEMSGLDIDTRSDIYSLGVLLYELLTGTTPFDIRALLESGFGEMLRAIREDEPHKPSTRISSLGETGTRTAQQRNVDAKKLSTMLRGDIDWIVMKCLEKDRSRRYETANGLAADILRHLNDEPVTAGAPGAAYRLQKFVKRNRGQVLAGSAIVLALLAGLVAFAWKAEEASEQRDAAILAREAEAEQRRQAELARAEAENQRRLAEEQEALAKLQEAEAKRQEAEALRQAAMAEAVAKFQTDMLAAVDPNQLPLDPVTKEPLRDQVTVVQALEAAVAALDAGSLAEQPLVEAKVRKTIGLTLQALARFDDADRNLQVALEIRRESLPADHELIAEALTSLGMLRRDQGRSAEGEKLVREALAIYRKASPAGHPDLANTLAALAIVIIDQGRLDEAEALFHESYEMFRASRPAGHPDLANSLSNLATLELDRGRPQDAEVLHREALSIWRVVHPQGHPEIARSLNNLAAALKAQAKFAEAESMFRESLAIHRANLSPTDPSIALALHNLGSLMEDQRRFAEAEALFRESLAVWRTAAIDGHPYMANCMRGLARALVSRGESREAERLFRESLEMSRATLPAGHPNIASSLEGLASLLMDEDRFAGAEPLLRELLQILVTDEAAEPIRVISARNNLALTLLKQNRLVEAEPLLRSALEQLRVTVPANDRNIQSVLDNLAWMLETQGRLAESLPFRRELLQIARMSLPEGRADLPRVMNNLGLTLLQLNELAEAESLFREALEILQADRPASEQDFAQVTVNLGGTLFAQKELAEAVVVQRQALALMIGVLPAEHPSVLQTKAELVTTLHLLGEAAEAIPLVLELVEALRALIPKNSPELAATFAMNAQILLDLKAWEVAEPLIREALAIREAKEPDDWRTFNTRSLLGGALLGQGKLAEAEPLLLDGYRGMKEREASIPPQGATRIPECLERLVRLCEAKGNPAEAAEWRGKLEAARANAPAATDGGK